MSNLTISDVDTPDPWIIPGNGLFYLTFTLDNRIEIWSSPVLEDFHNPQKSTIWQPAPNTPWSVNIWAPELHYLKGRWYIYTCGAPPGVGNPGHRTTLLRCSSQDPMDASAWEFLGPLEGLPDQWSIDATVFSPDGGHSLYCCWSGWPPGDTSDTQQDLFLAKMSSPERAIPDSVTCISHASLPWERPDSGRRGVNEGPTWVDMPHHFRGIVYSADGSWTSHYKLALLSLPTGADPLNPHSWQKRPEPLLVSHRRCGGPHGPGHASFLPNPHDRGRVYCVYHATAGYGEGWANRKARVIDLAGGCFAPGAKAVCCALENHVPKHKKDELKREIKEAAKEATRGSCTVS
ncbi:glycoside hydrolase family 43 protein (alpha-L-arabinofuranosidase II) [Colletotrichum sojae]|uniref:Glycoside hydrolase family 43 protein (Alpha-L-arabinofuranosidase II) n=1 Tax=Colletotrichum sojae TaxID=2175907 RepID=A0A8H6IXY0_9PEZI|nr:glycoside hydrolase family 43 protein (alpha-L-arabinofuranosidase II) [Colletotrichum sojae]